MVEYGVVIRRQLPKGELRWQFWTGSGVAKENPSFLTVMNYAGSLGYEAVAAGHFDELGVPEVLLQRRMELLPVAMRDAPLLPASPESASETAKPVARRSAAKATAGSAGSAAAKKAAPKKPAPAKG